MGTECYSDHNFGFDFKYKLWMAHLTCKLEKKCHALLWVAAVSSYWSAHGWTVVWGMKNNSFGLVQGNLCCFMCQAHKRGDQFNSHFPSPDALTSLPGVKGVGSKLLSAVSVGGRDGWNKSVVQEEADEKQGEQLVSLPGRGREWRQDGSIELLVVTWEM